MRLVSTLEMVNLSQDPTIFNDGEVYFNTLHNAVRLSYSGSWVDLVDSSSIKYYLNRNINTINAGTASYSYLILDSQQNSILLANSASLVNFIVPNNSTENIDIGSSIKVVRSGLGDVQFTPEAGVTLHLADSNYLTAQWTSAELVKIGTNEWFLEGEFPDIY